MIILALEQLGVRLMLTEAEADPCFNEYDFC